MKTPRVNDFDPKAKVPALGSPMDDLPPIQQPKPDRGAAASPRETGPMEPDRATDRPDERATGRPTDRATGKRLPVRRGFEFYEDQLQALTRLSYEEKLAGRPGSMSRMVREAVDEYLEKHATKPVTDR
jgi:hypothetical protein